MKNLPKKKIYAGIVAGLVLVSLIGGVMWKGQAQTKVTTEEILAVRTAVVSMAGAGQNFTYSGDVHGRYESQLAFQVGGKIIKRNVQLGSTVNSGDILMQIDPKDVRQTVNNNLAQVDSAASGLRLAESNLNRYRQLYEGNAVSRSTLDQYENAYEVAKSNVRQASAQYTQGANQLDYSLLYADKGGIVSSITAEAGQVVSAGQSVITIVQDGEREVEINVPENRIDELRKVKELKVTFWALPTVSVDAVIREIAPMADAISRTYKVRVSLLKPPQEVKLGMTSTVMVANMGEQKTAAYIPLAAIYQPSNTPGVWVINDETVTLRSIKIGTFVDGKVQVLEGLQNGDVIVTAGVHKLREGQKVRIIGDTL
ncbi:efflux RND transporter periplasmic adaptor subunit [Pelosinus sp. sgz500959]|uniref:efflux RND transporter periplasmic adaptor subunit n=1 Tax=Pelosinus sp. sgz500959 TaxID=3242472 RepID=UPI003671E037